MYNSTCHRLPAPCRDQRDGRIIDSGVEEELAVGTGSDAACESHVELVNRLGPPFEMVLIADAALSASFLLAVSRLDLYCDLLRCQNTQALLSILVSCALIIVCCSQVAFVGAPHFGLVCPTVPKSACQ